jgi:CBS domain containing-hemolysin-like protein
MAWTVWIPREIARCWGAPFLAHTWPVWRWTDRIFFPINAFTTLLRIVTRRLDGRKTEWSEEEALEDEILSLVTEGQHDGLLEDDVREMIAGVIELDDTDVADIMTPRSDMDVIPVDLEWEEMLKFVVRVGRTRIPIYEKTLDNVVGVLYVKDLLAVLAVPASDKPRELRSILREVKRVPRSTRLDELLQNFLNNRTHLAIVVDEFMHVVGLVTIEDVLEEIVGEIMDESDQDEVRDVRWVSEGVAEIQARAHVEELNELLGIELPLSPEYDTLGGYVLHHFGRIPQPGESIQWQDLQLTVQSATKRRVELLRLDLNHHPRILSVT